MLGMPGSMRARAWCGDVTRGRPNWTFYDLYPETLPTVKGSDPHVLRQQAFNINENQDTASSFNDNDFSY